MNSKVKEVKGCKEWTGEHGTVYYHALIMDNGDKLNIGKKKENYFKVGDSVEYEITGQPDDNGWCKAKHITQSFNKGFPRESWEERSASFALRYAVDVGIAKDKNATETMKIADVFLAWLRVNGKQ